MEQIVESVNKLIKYLEHAQSKGTFSLSQSHDIYSTILNMKSLLQNPSKTPAKSILETIPENDSDDEDEYDPENDS